ncbi:MAG: lysoplasmalogenase [Desulfobacterales bacterium]|nr:lysoplasmalogenase [Desulfobacterales bacterium]
MTPQTLILLLAPFILAALLLSERNGSIRFKIVFKFLLSSLFLALALVQTALDYHYAAAVIGGLSLCLVGDVALAVPGPTAFRLGLVAFLLGHVGYIVAFAMLARPGAAMWVTAIAAVPVSTLAYARLLPFLDGMRHPVMGYVVVITLMLITAGALYGAADFSVTGRLLVINGALAFYISDLFVARQRFVYASFYNRLIGLPLYYLGQFQIAYSIGLVG